MKITGVRTQLYEIPLDRAIGDVNSPEGRRRMAGLAVFLDSDEGITGIALGSPGAQGNIRSIVENLLLGRDPRGVRGLWKKMMDYVFKGGAGGSAGEALSALDVALWDLKAKANNEPLWKALGASSRCVRAYASGLDLPLSDTELRAYYEGMAKRGISAGKLKVGLDVEEDLRRIGLMQEALATNGKKPALMIDSNEYWSPKQAIRHIQYFEQHYDLTWVEEPARRWDYRGLRQVSRGVRAAVATGENLDELADYVPLISNEAVDIVEVGSGQGGITGALLIAELAYAYELPVALMNCPANFMAHVAAVLPNHIMMEVLGAGRDKVLRVDNHIEDGWIVLGDQPGLGIEYDEAKLAAAAVERPSREAGASPWGRRRGAALLEVGRGEPDEMGEE
jgi:L-alanine-DL-glutamate epimerase-like enolase superfamily enzyme